MTKAFFPKVGKSLLPEPKRVKSLYFEKKTMQAELIAIGDEILIGQTLDTNSRFIAGRLNAIGILVKQKRVIADEAASIKHALDTVHPDTDLIFMTGGLGPTRDDITKHTLLEYFGGELVFESRLYEHIVQLFKSFDRIPKESNKGQAYVPSSARAILNDLGTAPGMHFQKEGRHYFSTPGVPYETEHLVGDKILPWIEEHLQKGTIYHRNFLTQGIPESDLAERLVDWENALPQEVKLAYLPAPGMVRLRLSTYTNDLKRSKELVDQEAEKLKAHLGMDIFGEGNSTLEEVIGILLQERKASVATAESCTGGNIAQLISSVPGSSSYFEGGVVSYSNPAKIDLLEVPAACIESYGAVSEETVRLMAEGARRLFKTDFAIATSGIAGPGGGSAEKPVGTVWIAVAGPERTKAQVFRFGLHRGRNVRRSSLMALDMLRRELQKISSDVVQPKKKS